MSLEFVHCEDLAEPLTSGRSLQSCQVAGKSLRQLQHESFNLLDDLSQTVYVRSNSWLSDGAIKTLLQTSSSVRDGTTALAVFNKEDLFKPDTSGFQCQHSFAVRYAWDLLTVNELVVGALAENKIAGQVHDSVVIDGYVQVGAGSRLLPGVYIEGNAIIGEGCKIGPNCYIRGHTSIGDNCHIGQSVEIKNSIIMDSSNVGHLSYVGDSILGTKVNFGAGTVVSNLRHDGSTHFSMVQGKLVDTERRKLGVIIGDGVHTGINTSFYPGRKVWPSLTTLPGEIVRKDKK